MFIGLPNHDRSSYGGYSGGGNGSGKGNSGKGGSGKAAAAAGGCGIFAGIGALCKMLCAKCRRKKNDDNIDNVWWNKISKKKINSIY